MQGRNRGLLTVEGDCLIGCSWIVQLIQDTTKLHVLKDPPFASLQELLTLVYLCQLFCAKRLFCTMCCTNALH